MGSKVSRTAIREANMCSIRRVWQVPLPKPASWSNDQRKQDGCWNDFLLFSFVSA